MQYGISHSIKTNLKTNSNEDIRLNNTIRYTVRTVIS
jgi:hypothetical protein